MCGIWALVLRWLEGVAVVGMASDRLNELNQLIERVAFSITTEVANIEVASGGFAPKAKVLRSAVPNTVPDGPTPLAKGLAYAAGLFVFFIGYVTL